MQMADTPERLAALQRVVPQRKVFSPSPLHDQYSNGSDAFQVLAVGLKQANAVTDNLPANDIDSDAIFGLSLDDETPIAPAYEVDYEF